ncbi:hypothetical protein CEXT_800921 [Caerostris extrusa]|uniref:Uncharacterized protein n=1 Tax=Caerostris extrusa TaxID=172846 RepID=A0AAV4M9E4_CAEEX|nr:hypothetical protein CEXT_800921 [Caerostris extrusa]
MCAQHFMKIKSAMSSWRMLAPRDKKKERGPGRTSRCLTESSQKAGTASLPCFFRTANPTRSSASWFHIA